MTERATDLIGLLTDAGIRLKRTMAPGSAHKVMCPKCEGGRTREESLSVKIDDDGQGATWNCKRGSCGWSDGGKVANPDRSVPRQAPPKERRVVPPPPVAPQDMSRGASLYDWWAKRGISRETVDAFGIYVTKHWFPEHSGLPQGEHPAIVFPYVVGGKIVNRKYRSTKKMFMQEKDALPSLFNIDAVTSFDRVAWVEGEADVLAMHEAGYPQTVSLPNGAPAANVKNDDQRYAPLETHGDLLAKLERIILAGDMDEPGLALREELARRLGRHRCWLVTWPEGCKDANETLVKRGREGVLAAIEAAEPYPIQGVQTLRDDTLLALRRRPPPPTMTTGCGAADEAVRIPGEGRVIVVTGIPGSGKSKWVTFCMVHQMEHFDRKWAVFTPEMEPWPEYAAACAEVLQRKMFWPDPKLPLVPTMSEEDIRFATQWLRTRLFMLVSDSEDEAPTLDWWIDAVRALVLRHGITDALIDPWNEMDHTRGGMTMAEYISRSLQRLNAFARRHGVNVWIVNHPHSLKPARPGDPVQPPGLYDMDGGAAWANKGALILTVHRPADNPHTQLIVRKAKFRRLGRRGAMAELAYDEAIGTYSTPAG